MQRVIDAPDQDVLTKAEVCHYLRISERQLGRFIRAGQFPRGVPYGDRGPIYWSWQDVWSFRHLHGRLAPPALPRKKSTKKPANGG